MIKWSWDLGTYCNYKCDYCFFTQAGWENLERLQGGQRTVTEIERAWGWLFEKYGRSRIFITGGEPFLYPGFTEIASLLSRFHELHITSNLSQPLDRFLEKIKPENVELNSTYHPLHADRREFRGQVLKLRKSGFKCDVCYLAHPLQLREMLYYKKYFLASGINMEVTLFSGKYNGVDYPEGYEYTEQSLIRYTREWVSGEPGNKFEALWKNTEENPVGTLNGPDNDDKMEETGFICGAGREHANIGVDGRVRVCGQTEIPLLGNIYEHDVRLLERPYVCSKKNCQYSERGHI